MAKASSANRKSTAGSSARSLGSAEIAVIAAGVALVVTVVRSAWVCDHSFITFRTIDNFVHGHGLRWNVIERVQTFTHPLWMLVLTVFYLFTREAYYTVLTVSILLTAVTGWWLATRVAGSALGALLADPAWQPLETPGDAPVWTDSHSNLLAIMKWWR